MDKKVNIHSLSNEVKKNINGCVVIIKEVIDKAAAESLSASSLTEGQS